MKAQLFSSSGEKKSQVELPKIFETPIREDLVAKYFEASKLGEMHPNSPKYRAGLRQVATGSISHKRHDWKGHYGRGISRMPRKAMWRRGTQFFWIGANVPGARGGRKAFPPLGFIDYKKTNKKEMLIAMNSGFAATARTELVKKRYSLLSEVKEVPFVIESLPEKTKALKQTIKKILPENSQSLKEKSVRPGKGKSRGRKYKSTPGVLIVTAKDENKNFKGFNIKPIPEVKISDLYPLGRLTIYTHKAIQEFGGKK